MELAASPQLLKGSSKTRTVPAIPSLLKSNCRCCCLSSQQQLQRLLCPQQQVPRLLGFKAKGYSSQNGDRCHGLHQHLHCLLLYNLFLSPLDAFMRQLGEKLQTSAMLSSAVWTQLLT